MHDKICIDEEKPAMAVLWCAPEAIGKNFLENLISEEWNFFIKLKVIYSTAYLDFV